MAHQNTMQYAVTHGFADKFAALVADFREKAAQRKLYRHTLNELRTLGPRELNDLGLNSSMLKQIAYDAAYGK